MTLHMRSYYVEYLCIDVNFYCKESITVIIVNDLKVSYKDVSLAFVNFMTVNG